MNTTEILPRVLKVRQNFPPTQPINIPAAVEAQFAKISSQIKPGGSIAVGVGSRGIANLPIIVEAVLEVLKRAGANPWIIPAMGSHGGATPEGQLELLSSYGITESTMKVPIRASLEVRQIGATAEGIPVFCSTEALKAEGIVLINRIKPHTDFKGRLGSGIIKMAVVELGTRAGAP